MKLYTKPGACSTAIHIDLCWTGQPFEVEVVDAATMKSDAYRALNPTGAVPLLVDGDFVLFIFANDHAGAPSNPGAPR